MTFTISPQFIAEVFERYQQGLSGLPQEWGLEHSEGGLPLEFQNYFSSDAHCPAHLRSLIEESFWASLEKEEGRCHDLELVYCNYELADRPFVFADPIPFGADHLAKLSPAIPKSAAIGVWPDINNDLQIWGFESEPCERSGPCLRLKVLQPGTIIAGCGGQSYFIALLNRRQAGFIDASIFEPIKRRLDKSNEGLGRGLLETETKRYFPLMQLAREMRSHGHQGKRIIKRRKIRSLQNF